MNNTDIISVPSQSLTSETAAPAVSRRTVARAVRNVAPKAVKLLEDTIEDENVNRRDRVAAAKIIVKESLAPHDAATDKDLADMSEQELRLFLDTAEGELAKRAKLVSSPTEPVNSAQAIDMFS